jgi:hypothetical protein
VISGSYTKGSVKNGKKEVLYSLIGDEVMIHGYNILTPVECKTVMPVVLTVTSDLGSSQE